jgi:hypothetical protein
MLNTPRPSFDDRNLANNDDAIAKTISYLKTNDPTNANREYAVGLLLRMHQVAKSLAIKSELSFEEFVERYDQPQDK